MQLYESYFDEICKEDEKEVLTIFSAASTVLFDRFSLQYNDPKLLAVVFSKTYDAILNQLQKMQKDYSEYNINICDRLEIGYTDTQSEDDEKEGSFMVYVRDLNCKSIAEAKDPTLNSVELCTQWNVENTNNVKMKPETLRKISAEALDLLKKIGIIIPITESILPTFCIVYESILNFLKVERRDKNLFQYEINFISCFYIGAQETDNEDEIYIRPNIESKLKIKNDSIATGKYDIE